MAKHKLTPLMKKLLAKAVEDFAAREPTLWMSLKRAKAKVRRVKPTDTMHRLLRYIEQHQPISFAETLGFDWRFLGGLLTRHRVEWKDGNLYAISGEPIMAKEKLKRKVKRAAR